MQSEVIFAGFGGQGILLSARILAKTIMKAGQEVAWIPSYGPEMRGGTAYCTVVASDRPIGSPIVRNPNHLVAMNRPSLEKFAPAVRPGGVILANSSLIDMDSGRTDLDELRVPVVELANKLGNPRSANIVALTAFTARSGMADLDLLRESVREAFEKKPELIPLNMSAVDAGIMAAIK